MARRAIAVNRPAARAILESSSLSSAGGLPIAAEFYFIVLLNPNIAVERMRERELVQDGLCGRCRDRVTEVGAAGD